MNILTTLAQTTYYYESSYNSNTLTPEESAAAAGAFVFFMAIAFIFFIGLYVLSAVCLMQIFKKAGVKPWAAWVPVYNNWKSLEIGGQQGFWSILLFIPVINIVSVVFMYIAYYNIGLKLNKGGAFVLLAIFLPLIWLIVLALDKSPWNEAAGAPSLAKPEPETPQAPQQPTPPSDPTPPTPPTSTPTL